MGNIIPSQRNRPQPTVIPITFQLKNKTKQKIIGKGHKTVFFFSQIKKIKYMIMYCIMNRNRGIYCD